MHEASVPHEDWLKLRDVRVMFAKTVRAKALEPV
jgi:hypothetical protein